MRSALVFAAAPLEPTPRLRARLPRSEFVVAADGGARTALAFGYTPNVVIGDFDSLDPTTLRQLQPRHIPIEGYPRDKDKTDGQLAIERALQAAPDELWLLGFLGGPRLDMAIANVLLLIRSHVRTVLVDERNQATLVRPTMPYEWTPEAGEIVSLLPLTSGISVSTQGLRWPLTGDRLEPGDTRGISNEPVSKSARVEVDSGAVLLTRYFAQV